MKSATIALRTGIAAALLSLGTVASAAPVDFSFTGSGSAVFGPCNTANCLEGATIGLADDTGNAIPGSWSTSLDFTALLDAGTASGDWSFFDVGGTTTNDLFGTFTATLNTQTNVAMISYLVTGGDGMFTSFGGTGSSILTLTDFDAAGGFADFTEAGAFVVNLVPEPAIVSLLFAAGAVGLSSRRRRKSN